MALISILLFGIVLVIVLPFTIIISSWCYLLFLFIDFILLLLLFTYFLFDDFIGDNYYIVAHLEWLSLLWVT